MLMMVSTRIVRQEALEKKPRLIHMKEIELEKKVYP